jgi:hypothetical protein
MRWQGLHMDCFEEARAGEVRQTTRIVAIGFVGRKRLQRLTGLPGLDANDEQPKPRPDRDRASLQSGPFRTGCADKEVHSKAPS